MADDDPGRRKFLKVATACTGGGIGLALGVPALRLLASPTQDATVTAATSALDLGPIDRFRIGAEPRRVEIVAPVVQDAWTTARDVVLGAAFVRRLDETKIVALSAVCPHLGCAVGFVKGDKPHFLCACHDSVFGVDGERQTGPAERGMDPLPVEVKDGRLQLTWLRFRLGGSTREPT